MVFNCCVPFCKNKSNTPNVNLHRFPYDQKLLKIWINNIKTFTVKNKTNPKRFKVTGCTKICSAHFERRFIVIRSEKSVLQPYAVPTIFESTQSSSTKAKNENESALEILLNKQHLANTTNENLVHEKFNQFGQVIKPGPLNECLLQSKMTEEIFQSEVGGNICDFTSSASLKHISAVPTLKLSAENEADSTSNDGPFASHFQTINYSNNSIESRILQIKEEHSYCLNFGYNKVQEDTNKEVPTNSQLKRGIVTDPKVTSNVCSDIPMVQEKQFHLLSPKQEIFDHIDLDEDLYIDSEQQNRLQAIDPLSNINDSISVNTEEAEENLEEISTKMEVSEMVLSSDTEDEETTSEVMHAATELNELPQRSRGRYECAYAQFMNWRQENNVNSFSEDVLLRYFEELAKKVAPSTLWTQYSMLRSTMDFNNNIDLTQYVKLKAFLKSKSLGYKPRKSKVLSPLEIKRFLNEAPDDTYLLHKVILIIGVSGACRKNEIVQMKVSDITDFKTAALFQIPGKGTSRSFTLIGKLYQIYKKYAVLRPPDTKEERFFLNYQHRKCTRQPVGINKIGSMPKQIAQYLGLKGPEYYTGHCYRRSSATIFLDPDGEITPTPPPGKRKTSAFTQNIMQESTNSRVLPLLPSTSNCISTIKVEPTEEIEMKTEICDDYNEDMLIQPEKKQKLLVGEEQFQLLIPKKEIYDDIDLNEDMYIDPEQLEDQFGKSTNSEDTDSNTEIIPKFVPQPRPQPYQCSPTTRFVTIPKLVPISSPVLQKFASTNDSCTKANEVKKDAPPGNAGTSKQNSVTENQKKEITQNRNRRKTASVEKIDDEDSIECLQKVNGFKVCNAEPPKLVNIIYKTKYEELLMEHEKLKLQLHRLETLSNAKDIEIACLESQVAELSKKHILVKLQNKKKL